MATSESQDVIALCVLLMALKYIFLIWLKKYKVKSVEQILSL